MFAITIGIGRRRLVVVITTIVDVLCWCRFVWQRDGAGERLDIRKRPVVNETPLLFVKVVVVLSLVAVVRNAMHCGAVGIDLPRCNRPRPPPIMHTKYFNLGPNRDACGSWRGYLG